MTNTYPARPSFTPGWLRRRDSLPAWRGSHSGMATGNPSGDERAKIQAAMAKNMRAKDQLARAKTRKRRLQIVVLVWLTVILLAILLVYAVFEYR